MNNIINHEKIKADALVEVWQQDVFGKGISAELNGRWRMSDVFGLNFHVGYKTEGYLMGKQMKAGLNAGVGISVYSN